MKLLSVNRARSIWIVPLFDLNPFGRSMFSTIPAVVEKYKFLQAPSKLEELDTIKGIKFLGGTFLKNEHEIHVELTVFADGILAETRSSTDDSDAFLDELLTWQVKEHGIVPYQEHLRSKLYLSELWVWPERPLDSINQRLEAFSKRLTSLIGGYSHLPINYETTGIVFSTEPTIVNPPAAFLGLRGRSVSLLKKTGIHPVAPLPTTTHIELLAYQSILLKAKLTRRLVFPTLPLLPSAQSLSVAQG